MAAPRRVFWPPTFLFPLVLTVTMVKLSSVTLQIGALTALVQTTDLKLQAQKRSALERRDLDSMVDREIKDMFSDFSCIDVDVRRIDNNTLRMEIRFHELHAIQQKHKIGNFVLVDAEDKMSPDELPRESSQCSELIRAA